MNPPDRALGRGALFAGLALFAAAISWPTMATLYLLWYGTRP